MAPDQVILLSIVASLAGFGALYGVIRLAVTHAIRSSLYWQHDGRFDRELAIRRRFAGRAD
ncbi:hypothetical protein AVP41_00705 [Microbacterium sp. TNHR37B]|nr:hypothetical protein AVP41_00705 [Microbacterium sp. TNHR37B]